MSLDSIVLVSERLCGADIGRELVTPLRCKKTNRRDVTFKSVSNLEKKGAPAAWFVRMEELSPIWAAFDCGVREKFSFSEPYSIHVWKRIEGEAPSEHRFI